MGLFCVAHIDPEDGYMHAAPLNAGYQTGLRPGASAGAEYGMDVQSEIEGLRLNRLAQATYPNAP
jgi:hypothetical protein